MEISQRFRLLLCVVFEAASLGDVIKAIDCPGNFSPLIFERDNVGDDIDALTIRPLDDDFHVTHFGYYTVQDFGHRRLDVGHGRAVGKKRFERSA